MTKRNAEGMLFHVNSLEREQATWGFFHIQGNICHESNAPSPIHKFFCSLGLKRAGGGKWRIGPTSIYEGGSVQSFEGSDGQF